MSDADQARIAARYPSRTPGSWVVVGCGVVATAIGLGWLVWTSLFHANPAITARVSSFHVTSDSSAEAIVTVQRSASAVSGVCTLIAQAESFERVGEVDITIDVGGELLGNHPVIMKTIKRATSLSVTGCRQR